MRGRVAAGVVGSALVLLVWGAGRGGDDPGPPDLGDPTATSTPPTTMGPGQVHVVLADDDEETPDLTWDVDLATATSAASSALCGPSGSFHLAVVDRTASPLLGLRLSTVSPWSGPGAAPVNGQLLPEEGPDVDVTGTITVAVDGEAVSGTFELRDDDGAPWTGTFSCGP